MAKKYQIVGKFPSGDSAGDTTEAELRAIAKQEAEGLVAAHEKAVNAAIENMITEDEVDDKIEAAVIKTNNICELTAEDIDALFAK